MSNFEEQFRSFAQALLGAAIHVSSNRPTLAALEADHRQLVNELAALDKIQCLGLVAALLTLPQFHANTLRLEILQLLIHKNAVGQNLPSYIGLDR